MCQIQKKESEMINNKKVFRMKKKKKDFGMSNNKKELKMEKRPTSNTK